MLLNRTALAIILISIIVLAGVTWLIFNQTENQVKTQKYEVKITDFNWTSRWAFGPVGTSYGRSFNVTLQNSGIMDLQEVKIEVKLFDNSNELWSQTWLDEVATDGHITSHPNVTFGISAGEIREFDGGFMTKLEELNEAQGDLTFKVTCMLNSTILGELPLPNT